MNNISTILALIKEGTPLKVKDNRLRGFRKFIYHMMRIIFRASSWIIILLTIYIMIHG